MKQKIQQFLVSPKLVVTTAIIIAVSVGVMVSRIHKNTLAQAFAEIKTIPQPSTDTTTSTSSQNLTLAFPIGGRIESVSVKIGDKVEAGQKLASLDAENALGAVNQAKAAYTAATVAYQKLLNGASSADIKVSQVALTNAKNNYDATVAQEKVLVANAYALMLSSGLAAIPTIKSDAQNEAPTISGTYTGTDTASYTITLYNTGAGNYFSFSGSESGNGPVSTTPVPLGTKGLYIQFSSNNPEPNTWVVSVPNTHSSTYLTNQNAYQSALQNQSQAIAQAQGLVDAAQAALDQKIAGARSEDLDIAKAQVESTQGALQIAQGAYNNTIIIAPVSGVITNVSITAGQIATANTPAIELLPQ